ncbi:hypothetical protein ACWEPL_60505 [Nonomuraea sp. NPDC004186]
MHWISPEEWLIVGSAVGGSSGPAVVGSAVGSGSEVVGEGVGVTVGVAETEALGLGTCVTLPVAVGLGVGARLAGGVDGLLVLGGRRASPGWTWPPIRPGPP